MSDYYDWAILDAQYFLVRNTAMFYKNPAKVHYGQIVQSFLYSLMKLEREKFSFGRLVLCWDIRNYEGEYNKSAYLPGYKANRVHTNELYAMAMENPQDYTKEQLKKIKDEYHLWCEREKAKKFIMENLGSLGITNLCIPGYEADDFACILTEMIKDGNNIIITTDGDWQCLVNEHFDFYHTKRDYIYTLDEVQAMYKNNKMDLYKFKFLEEIFKHSHNGVTNPIKGILNYNQVVELYEQGEMNFLNAIEDVDRRKAARDAIHGLDIRRYCRDIYPIVNAKVMETSLDYNNIDKFYSGSLFKDTEFKDFYLTMNEYNLQDFIRGFDSTKFCKFIGEIRQDKVEPEETFEEFFGL